MFNAYIDYTYSFKVETSQIRQEIEKRLAEKEEDFENTRRNHQRALESLQVEFEFNLHNSCSFLDVLG